MRVCDNPQCGQEFKPRRSWQRFCKDKCRHDNFKLRTMTAEDVRKIVRLEIRAIKENSD